MRNRTSQARAIQLRKSMTDAERKLWQTLRLRQIVGCKFRRQYPVGAFIADFACVDAKLIVEVDGGQHAERTEQDQARSDRLAKYGFTILRFWNDEVLQNTDAVLSVIEMALRNAPTPSLPRTRGREFQGDDR